MLYNTNEISNGSINIFHLIILAKIVFDSEYNAATLLYKSGKFNYFLLYLSS